MGLYRGSNFRSPRGLGWGPRSRDSTIFQTSVRVEVFQAHPIKFENEKLLEVP